MSGKKLTNVAEVLFCDPFLLEFQAAVFAETDRVTFLDIRSFKGNIFGLRGQAESYIKEHVKWRADLSESSRREIPVRSFPEAIEKWASGIKRIYEECQKSNVKVEFNRAKTGFVVVFHRPKESGIIKRIGPDKGGCWEVLRFK